MEDILDVYQRPYDPQRPVVCLDETSKELRSTPRGSILSESTTCELEDYEYERHGTRNLFLWVEPLVGKRRVQATKRRTYVDFAEVLRQLVDEDYPEAEHIVLVTDNLNTHTTAALYERFEPEEARRIANRIEWHYTPEHGSWLNMAETELSVLSRQCLSRRIPDAETLERNIAVWERKRNATQITIDWQFTTADARIKLKRLYPQIRQESVT
jgi:transposase